MPFLGILKLSLKLYVISDFVFVPQCDIFMHIAICVELCILLRFEDFVHRMLQAKLLL